MSAPRESSIIDAYFEQVRAFKMKDLDEEDELYDDLRRQAEDEVAELRAFADSLDDKERKALEIAIEHLEDSFDAEKCISFVKTRK